MSSPGPLPKHLDEALALVLDRAHALHPDELGDVVAEAIGLLAATEVEIYIADLGQDVLLRYYGHGEAELEIDATMAGRAYRSLLPVSIDLDGGLSRVWMPILDGADRLGVLGAVVSSRDDELIVGLEKIATLAAELLVARAHYGDGLALARRRMPLSLASEMRWSLLPPRTFATNQVTISAVVDAMGHGIEASRIANLVVGCYPTHVPRESLHRRNRRRRDDCSWSIGTGWTAQTSSASTRVSGLWVSWSVYVI